MEQAGRGNGTHHGSLICTLFGEVGNGETLLGRLREVAHRPNPEPVGRAEMSLVSTWQTRDTGDIFRQERISQGAGEVHIIPADVTS